MATKKTFLANNRFGMHARPSAQLVQAIANLDAEIVVSCDGMTGNAKSLLEFMSVVGASGGREFTILAQGKNELEVIATISQLVEAGFGES